MEVLDGEREVWERQERDRRGMFAEDEVKIDLDCVMFVVLPLARKKPGL